LNKVIIWFALNPSVGTSPNKEVLCILFPLQKIKVELAQLKLQITVSKGKKNHKKRFYFAIQTLNTQLQPLTIQIYWVL